ncbi:Bug family tripartite tricarboxylate transporter substrate binding protein [Plastoroseomonas hellenica]|uniref:Bug family tripartite tricarboxylate transporter substrate binding protein n=1 Tax=Plastoroseomonas hellenica TaxID=2687306 RepID=UPI001BA58B05|nr:tripartite tricarboxylate transporter substrate binding protein [Plastoroseomonas hellenica]MBR0642940.1 tripartite tricarboxylate transporter substrate binding protein [Plastoroseomonas hellenica]
MLKRRHVLALPAAAPLGAPALAQAPWPNRPVRVLVGFPPGGSLDVLTRMAAEQMAQRLGQPFVVETRSGASGNIAAEALARAPADGYTISTVSMHTVVINPMVFPSVPFDAARDFQWISAMWDLPNVFAVPAQHVPVQTAQDFVAWARGRRGGVSYGSPGAGTTGHLSGAYFASRAGIEATHVPFRGAAQTIPAMLGGDVHMAIDNLASYTGVIQSGSIRPLAVTMPERWPTLPEVPTMAEAGFDRFNVSPWHFWAGPAGMPREIAERLSREIRATWANPDLQQRAIAMGARLTGSTPEALGARLGAETPRWAEMVRISGAQAG